MFVFVMRKPCTTSELVARNVMGVFAGHEQALRRERILLRDDAHGHRAVGLDRAAEVALDELARHVQRFGPHRLHARRRHHRPLQPRVDHHPDEHQDDHDDERRPAPLDALGDIV